MSTHGGYAGSDRLRDGLVAAGYTVDAVADRLGPAAQEALARHETVPARRATRGGDPLDTLVRLFLLQLPVPAADAARALPLEVAHGLGLVATRGDDVRATLDLRPYGETAGTDGAGHHPSWVVSDLGTGLDGAGGPLPTQHVLGVGGASTTLAQLTPRAAVGRTVVRRSGGARRVTTLDWPHPVEQRLGPHVAGWLDRRRWLADRAGDAALAASTLTLATDVVQEQLGRPGAEDPEHVVLRQQVGLGGPSPATRRRLRSPVRATGRCPWAD